MSDMIETSIETAPAKSESESESESGRTDSSYGAASLDSNTNQVTQGATAAAAPGSSTRPASARNHIITADSIINTIQVGLTAAAINAATRSRVTCVSDQSQPASLLSDQSGARAVAERPAAGQPGHVIAPRPSLGRVDAVMDTVSSLSDNLASLLVSDSASSAQFSSLLGATHDPASRQSRLASMFTSESPVPGAVTTSSHEMTIYIEKYGQLKYWEIN